MTAIFDEARKILNEMKRGEFAYLNVSQNGEFLEDVQ